MAVVGFDAGTYSSYIGVARAGGIETIANEYSDRCTPSYVSLNEKTRNMGAAAKQQAVTNFKNTVAGFKRLLGRTYQDPFVQKEMKQFFRANEVGHDKEGNVLNYMGEKQAFTAQQLVAMLLTKLKLTAEAALKTKVVDAVISVPVFYTDAERRALLDASALAGINCLRLINDTTAAALGYGITKQDLPAETEKPRVVVFADLGYSALQVSACAFNKGKLKVLAVSCDPEVGGRDFDEVLAKHFSAEFRGRYKIDPESKPKPYIRLLQECEKLKKLMSANTQAIPLNIECFMDDKDVSSKLSRDDFEQLSQHLLQRIETTLAAVMTNAKLKPNEIHSVEILGGSSRIPAFKRLVSQVFSKEPSTTLNADEAVARGCALQCAILSPTFRVRDFSISDCQLYPITLSWVPQNQMDEDSQIEVFSQFHSIPASKMLTFYRKEPFTLSAMYSQPANVPFARAEIGQFKVSGVSPQPNGESSKVKVKVRVNGSGLFSVSGATMYEKVEGEEISKEDSMEVDAQDEKKDSGNVSNGSPDEATMEQMTTDASGAATREQDQSMETQNSQEGSNGDQEKKLARFNGSMRGKKRAGKGLNGAPVKVARNHTDQLDEASKLYLWLLRVVQSYEEEGEKDDKKGGKKARKVKSVDLPIDVIVPQLNKEQLNLLIEKEGQMIMQDRLEKERADAKNSVEEYVYDMRDKLYNAYAPYIKEEDRDKFVLKLEDVENWLYDEGEDQNKQVYIDKLAELKKTGQPVQTRYREAEEWPQARDQFGGTLMHVRKFLDLYNAGDEKYSHLEKADVDKVQKCFDEKMSWWGPKMEAQSRIKPHEDPVLLVSQVLAEKKNIETTCNPIITKPKPKVEPPKEEKAEGADTSTNNSGGGDVNEQQQQQQAADSANPTDSKSPEMEVD
ncbi:hypothetical protein BaRGS_00012372 [Batillaria attramentaria]|uniref:Uncharacterized protein n=1 Tax=Batillaria attramentaria TaxID=370345 RepID=A0ABD0LB37_9CAEN